MATMDFTTKPQTLVARYITSYCQRTLETFAKYHNHITLFQEVGVFMEMWVENMYGELDWIGG